MASKRLEMSHPEEVDEQIAIVEKSARCTFDQLTKLQSECSPIELLAKLKFEKVGADPLDFERPLNVIEQHNQTFTYVASFRAAKRLFVLHPSLRQLTINLGTAAGPDLESAEFGGIAAEVIAATRPASKSKHVADIKKVSLVRAAFRYSFFMCPNIDAGEYNHPQQGSVVIESLGPYQ